MIWDASDANPMHRRLPAEVISRRQPAKSKKQEEPKSKTDEVAVDLKAAITLKPEARAKWLSKACVMVEQGKGNSNDLYDIVTNRKFSGGLPEKVGRKLAASLRDSMAVFSDKQQRFLMSSDSPLGALMSVRDEPDDAEEKEERRKPLEPSAASGGAKLQITTSRESRVAAGASSRQDVSSTWQVAEDDATIRRMKALEAKEVEKKEKEQEASGKKEQAEDEEAKRKKLEEEADNLFGFLAPAADAAPPIFSKADRKRSASRSAGSRSISSRTARRQAREQKRKKDRGWRESSGGALSGSRAMFLNRNYTEDLPHLPRNAAQSQNAATDYQDRSRSRDRRRRRD
mmetsp:Transcript_25405/g.46099  ORF Transcript_25405/g.46099 Transcript_25405/m.46099 type:complete len:344 (-) Transcript_25405:32-1063(-)